MAIHKNFITAAGRPFLSCHVGLSLPRQSDLIAAGLPVPPTVTCNFVIDTGAPFTAIDPALLSSFETTGETSLPEMMNPDQRHICAIYELSIFIPNKTSFDCSHLVSSDEGSYLAPNLKVIGMRSLRAHRVDGFLGHDVLENCIFIYDGRAKSFTLAH